MNVLAFEMELDEVVPAIMVIDNVYCGRTCLIVESIDRRVSFRSAVNDASVFGVWSQEGQDQNVLLGEKFREYL